jgi:hypothetical protein
LNKTADYNAIKEIAKILKVKGERKWKICII